MENAELSDYCPVYTVTWARIQIGFCVNALITGLFKLRMRVVYSKCVCHNNMQTLKMHVNLYLCVVKRISLLSAIHYQALAVCVPLIKGCLCSGCELLIKHTMLLDVFCC